jgi:VIT1/CCC1 family predicted Fe2+/Mn2+ transporter
LKKLKNRTVSIGVALGDYNLDAVRYAAHAVSGAAHAFIRLAGAEKAVVEFTPAGSVSGAGIAAAFRAELADEKLRASIYAANRELRDFMILKALSAEEAAPPAPQDDSGLTPEQEKELDALIAQVESEIKREAASGAAGDPLGITRTWEDKYGAKKSRKKN